VHEADRYLLRFTLRNVAGRPLTFYRTSLPWATPDSIQVAAVTTDGQLVPAGYPIEDHFETDQVQVKPNQTLTGDYDLAKRWEERSTPSTGFPRGATIVLMWTYKVRALEISAKRWPVCSGVTSFKAPA